MYRKKEKRIKASLNALMNRKKKLFNMIIKNHMFCNGTIGEKFEICGNKKCACRNKTNPKLHGPYKNLYYRGGDKNGTLHLTLEKAEHAKIMVQQYKKVTDIIQEVACINLELLRRKNFDLLKNEIDSF
jgi:hypothetical protein